MKAIVKAAGLTAAGCALVAGTAGMASADGGVGAGAKGAAVGSPGVISGNVVQVPIGIPINLCGNTIDIIALLNPASGTDCSQTGKVVKVDEEHHHHAKKRGHRHH
ncbi:chaplin [Streptomyces sp. B1866]|uniref:chaplin n=1 Tax=Streptomyces sp. B1866 TaxID=3075431 RepID=UPI0028918331|nr:chaplin [Streptomyces sp. B1866]MDT3397511.1 chaplin [Streptomyces sp. B1866]